MKNRFISNFVYVVISRSQNNCEILIGHKYITYFISFTAIYKHMLSDKKFGLTANLLATKVMPTLIPHTATPGMSLDQVSDKTHCSYAEIFQIKATIHWVLLIKSLFITSTHLQRTMFSQKAEPSIQTNNLKNLRLQSVR